MPTIVMAKPASKLEPAIKKKAYAFLEKLGDDDTLPGLHIEPMKNPLDSRVRTGRVDDAYRAVLFKLTDGGGVVYVFTGIWHHDEAIRRACTTTLTTNPVSGITEIRHVEDAPVADAPTPSSVEDEPSPARESFTPVEQAPYCNPVAGMDASELRDTVGLDPQLVARARAATSEEELLAIAAAEPNQWQGLALIDLAAGDAADEVRQRYAAPDDATEPDPDPDPQTGSDADVLAGMRHPSGRLTFAWIEGNEELRQVIEEGDFAAWRVFLHPEQRRYVSQNFNGPARLTGGAGTGKTVVVLHRARRLSRENPAARGLLTTFTTNLAAALDRDMRRLAPELDQARATHLGDPGLYVAGIDKVASDVLAEAGTTVAQACELVLGVGLTTIPHQRTAPSAWDQAIQAVGDALPESLRSREFFAAEYRAVVLPHRITSRDGYLKVKRPGRGVALDRSKRAVVWDVINRYRALSRADGTLDFDEAATIAAAWLTLLAEGDIDQRPSQVLCDYALVDEGQDLSPAHWQLLRALVAPGRNDLFIAEDSHQRIYGQQVRLSHMGIHVVGRSRALRLNYRTTEQNLRFAMRVLDGDAFTGLEGDDESHSQYRSARSGPNPILTAAESLDEELDRGAAIVKEWLDEGAAAETIAVLVRQKQHRDLVVSGFAERGVTARAVDQQGIKPGAIVAMTMHRAKGTEFAKVLLFGVAEGSIPVVLRSHEYSDDASAAARRRERSLLYVAATRARDELAVSWSRAPSPLLPR